MNVGVTDTETIIKALGMGKIARNHIGDEINEISKTF